MFALARIHVLVKIGAIEFRERVRVFRKMRRHPIHNDADAALMAAIDEMPELVGISETTGGCVIIRDLITPGAFEGMFRDGQQLDVRVAHFQNVRQQCLSELEVTEWSVFVRMPPPRTQMHFVNTERGTMQSFRAARFHPLVVAPVITVQIVNER